MKQKLLFSLLLLTLSIFSFGQSIYDTTTFRQRINQWVVPNSQRSITAAQINTLFNAVLNTRKISNLQYTDTSTMLSAYPRAQRFLDSVSTLRALANSKFQNLSGYLQHIDTSSMLSAYPRAQRFLDSVNNLRSLLNQKASITSLSSYYPISGGVLNGSVLLNGGGLIYFYTGSTQRSSLGINQSNSVGEYNRPFFFGGSLFQFKVNGSSVVSINEDGSINASSYTGSWSGNTIPANRLDFSTVIKYTDTGRAIFKIATAHALNKVRDSVVSLIPSSSTFVPYTGATANVDLQPRNLIATGLGANTINITTSNNVAAGNFQNNGSNPTISVYNPGGGKLISLAGVTAVGNFEVENNGDILWRRGLNTQLLKPRNLTGTHTVTFQDKTYTVADSADVANKLSFADTGRANGKLASAFALNKVKDSLLSIISNPFLFPTHSVSLATSHFMDAVVDGNMTAGTVEITNNTGLDRPSGLFICSVTFGATAPGTPIVVISTNGQYNGTFVVKSQSSTAFSVAFSDPAATIPNGQTVSFSYHIIYISST